MRIPALAITTPQCIQKLPCESLASKRHRYCPWILHPNPSTHLLALISEKQTVPVLRLPLGEIVNRTVYL